MKTGLIKKGVKVMFI